MSSSLKHKLNSRIKKKHRYTTLQRKYYKKVRRMITKYYNSKSKHRFHRIVRSIDRTSTTTLCSKRTLNKKFRSFSKYVTSLSLAKFGGISLQQRMKLPLLRAFNSQRYKKTSGRMKNTLPQDIDYALSTTYLDQNRIRKNRRELMMIKQHLIPYPVLNDEKYTEYRTRIMNLLTEDENVMRRLQHEWNRIHDRNEWKRQSSLGFKVKRFFTR